MTRRHTSQSLDDIAIVGMSGRFPGARNLLQFWDNLRNGVESISFFSEPELASAGIGSAVTRHPDFVNAGGTLDGIELFDAPFFGFTPREAETLDPQQRLLLECAWEALEDAACDPDTYKGAIGVYAGGVLSSYLFNLLSNREHRELVGDFQVFTGNDKDHLTTRISYKLNLKGPSVTVQTACSTSLVAVVMACQSLVTYQCDMALAGGVSIRVPQIAGYIHQEGMIFSRDGHCRPFDTEASGTLFSNGVGLVVLKRLAEALADGDFIHAVIKGSAINNDGSLKVGYTAPSLDAQAEVIAMAQAVAGVDPRTITYVEAHGTATPLGDPIEIAALTKAFRVEKGAEEEKEKFCAIGSVKSNLGHLDAAAGVAGLIKTVLSLENKLIPPSINFIQPNPVINFVSSPFYVNTQLSEWKSGPTPRRAGVSSFGIGGTNAHVVLEEAPTSESKSSSRPSHLVLLSARSKAALQAATAGFAVHLNQHPELNPADVAYTCQVGRRAFNQRRVLVYSDLSDAAAALESLDERRVLTASKSPGEHSIAFMFPGQGAQHVNMGAGLYRSDTTFRQYVDDCSELLRPRLQFDLREVLYPADGQEQQAALRLEQTEVAQPALFVIEYALAKLWMEWGVRPQTMIGHSIGEYVAACLAGVFSLEDALFLVAERGRLMQRLPRGSMLAVPLPEQDVQSLLDSDLEVAAINHPNSCVVSGPTGLIEELKSRIAQTGVECRNVRTSHAFHSRMMDPILEPFTAVVAKMSLRPPKIPYISNVTGAWITPDQATDPAYWAAHLRRTVLFSQGMGYLVNASNRVLLEVGPGRTLAALAQRHSSKTVDHVVLSSLGHADKQVSDQDCLLSTLGRLWLLGTEIDWRGFWRHERRYRVPLPTYPFERKPYWVDLQAPPEIPGHGPRQEITKSKSDVANWFYVPCWKQTVPVEVLSPPERSDPKACWLLFEDDCGVGSRVGDRIEQEGQTVVRVRGCDRFDKPSANQFCIDPCEKAHYDKLFQELRNSGQLPQNVLHCWNVTRASHQSLLDSLDNSQASGFYSLLFVAQALAEYSFEDSIHIGLVSNNLCSLAGTEELRPEKATTLGLCRVIPQEHPNFACRNIDIVLDTSGERIHQTLIDHLIAEVRSNNSEPVVAYRGNRRWIQTFEGAGLQKPAEAKSLLRENGVYLITGGLGGIGLTLAKYLAQTVRAKLVLVGRSQIPPRSDWVTLRDGSEKLSQQIRDLLAIEESGGEVMALAADVTDPAQMEEVVRKTCERFGAFHGVIHAAGVAGGGIVQLKTRELAAEVFAPKVKGTLVLDAVLKNINLDFLVLCSSVSSVLGGPGLADYAGANAFLDAFAQLRSSTGAGLVVSINWDAWQEVGMAVDSCSERLGSQHGIAPHQGVEAFSRILAANCSQVVVATTDLESAVHNYESATSPVTTAVSREEEPVALQPALDLGISRSVPTDEVERAIAEMWRKLLGVRQLGVYDDFFELGGDSLLGTRLLSLLRSTFRVQLPLQSLLEVPTVAGMAQRIRALR